MQILEKSSRSYAYSYSPLPIRIHQSEVTSDDQRGCTCVGGLGNFISCWDAYDFKVFEFRWIFWTCQTSFGIELWLFVTHRRLLTLGLGPKPEVKIKTGSFNLKFEPWKSIMSRSSQLFFKKSCLDKSSRRKIRSRLEGKGSVIMTSL